MLIADGLDVGSERERDVCDEIRKRMSLKRWPYTWRMEFYQKG